MLAPAIETLTAVGLASGVARSATVYALVSACHVLGIALLVGPIILADLRLAGWLRALDGGGLNILRRTARIGTIIVLLTGLLLLSAKPADYARNPVVWVKLIVVLAALVNAALFEMRARRHGLAALLERRSALPAFMSITLWLTALLLGRWIAFV